METKIDTDLLDGEKEIVLITHDESTFYCNEGRRLFWLENGKMKLQGNILDGVQFLLSVSRIYVITDGKILSALQGRNRPGRMVYKSIFS